MVGDSQRCKLFVFRGDGDRHVGIYGSRVNWHTCLIVINSELEYDVLFRKSITQLVPVIYQQARTAGTGSAKGKTN